jgi:hypothetical protein
MEMRMSENRKTFYDQIYAQPTGEERIEIWRNAETGHWQAWCPKSITAEAISKVDELRQWLEAHS